MAPEPLDSSDELEDETAFEDPDEPIGLMLTPMAYAVAMLDSDD